MKVLKERAEQMGTTPEALAKELAEGIVSRWEKIPKEIEEYIKTYPDVTKEEIKSLENRWKKLVGGEKLYLGSKKFLKDCEECEE